MNFEKAFKEMMKGKKIRRKEWENLMYIKYEDGKVKTFKGEYTRFFDNANVLVSDGWKVMDGDGTELTFVQALEEMKNKKRVTNKKWVDEGKDGFIFIDNNEFALFMSGEFQFMPTYQCLSSLDWEVMNDK